MSYSTVEFILFFVVFLVVYSLMPNVFLRQIVILAGNLFFYWFAGVDCLIIVVATAAVVYVFSRLMERVYAGYEAKKADLPPKERTALFAVYKRKCLKYVVSGVAVLLAVLVYVKVGKLLLWPEAAHFSDWQFKTVIVPLGISYYTFSSVGYLLDIFWNKVKCEHNFLKLFLCISFFPTIVQGPISRYPKLMQQFDRLPGFQYERVCSGVQLMLWGFFKKLVIADRLAIYTDNMLAEVGEHAGVELVVLVIFNALNLYADFSGCMDIVCGVAETMGVELEKNFNHPFFSKTAAEFWRRWHITLGAWFKDYVYMPLAMSPGFMKRSVKIRQKHGARAGQIFATAIPLIIVWILTGLWHGTGMDYLAWGIYWGVLIILGAVLAPEFKKLTAFLKIDTDSFAWKLFQMVRTFCIFCGGRMLTMTGSLHGCLTLVKNMVRSPRLWVLFDDELYQYGLDRKDFSIVLVGIFLMWAVAMLQERMKIRETLAKQPVVFRWLIYYAAFLSIIIFGVYGPGFDASSFVYGGY